MIEGARRRSGGLRRLLLAAALMMQAAAVACAAADPPGGADAMRGTLLKTIGESDGVFLVRLGAMEKTTLQGRPFQRFQSEILETFRGISPGGKSLWVSIPAVGPEWPSLESGMDVVFLLRSKQGLWTPHPKSDPLPVPKEGREAFLQAIRDYVKAASPASGATAQRVHLLKMLESGIAVFQEDASRSALEAKGWPADEIERLIVLVLGDDKHEPIGGLARENVTATLMLHAPVPRAVSFGRGLLKQGEFRTLYPGLMERSGKEAEEIVKAFLDDPEEPVKVGGLKVAGLLRRSDLLDAFEARYAKVEGGIPAALKGALKEARALAEREL